MNLANVSLGIMGLLAGAAMIILRKEFLEGIVSSQKSFFSNHYSEREIRGTRILIVMVGTLFMLFGIAKAAGFFEQN